MMIAMKLHYNTNALPRCEMCICFHCVLLFVNSCCASYQLDEEIGDLMKGPSYDDCYDYSSGKIVPLVELDDELSREVNHGINNEKCMSETPAHEASLPHECFAKV